MGCCQQRAVCLPCRAVWAGADGVEGLPEMRADPPLCRGWRVSCDVGQQPGRIRHPCAALLGVSRQGEVRAGTVGCILPQGRRQGRAFH